MSGGGPFLLFAAFVGDDIIVAVPGQDRIAVGGRWEGGGCYRGLRWMTDYGLKPGKSIIPGGVIARIDNWDSGEGASSSLLSSPSCPWPQVQEC